MSSYFYSIGTLKIKSSPKKIVDLIKFVVMWGKSTSKASEGDFYDDNSIFTYTWDGEYIDREKKKHNLKVKINISDSGIICIS